MPPQSFTNVNFDPYSVPPPPPPPPHHHHHHHHHPQYISSHRLSNYSAVIRLVSRRIMYQLWAVLADGAICNGVEEIKVAAGYWLSIIGTNCAINLLNEVAIVSLMKFSNIYRYHPLWLLLSLFYIAILHVSWTTTYHEHHFDNLTIILLLSILQYMQM